MAKTWIFKKNTKDELVEILKEIWETIDKDYKTYPRQKFHCKFRKEVFIHHNSKLGDMEEAIGLAFFLAGAAKDKPCYSVRISPRHGYYVTESMIENIESITIYTNAELHGTDKAIRFVGRFHPNLWQNLKDEILADPTKMETRYYNNYATTNIKNKFPAFVIEELRKAIEEQKDYSWKQYGEKRDLSVSTKMGEDGVFRAWFSSEYSGCGNGSYYILINPTTAALREDD